jgi:predicted ATPase
MSGSEVKRIVISGGPGSGKTTLIKRLESSGHRVFHEVSREFTRAAQQQGIDQLFLKDPLHFSRILLEARTSQFSSASGSENQKVFYDRGLPDVLSYMDYLGVSYTDHFLETCKKYRYDQVFLLPPWEEIYVQDSERYETFQKATEIYRFLRHGYRKFDYDIVEIPPGSIDERVNLLLDRIDQSP